MVGCFAMAVDGGTSPQTQQPTVKLNRGGFERNCDVNGRGESSRLQKHNNQPKWSDDLNAQLFCHAFKICSSKTDGYFILKLSH
jgi:hypothetical protein